MYKLSVILAGLIIGGSLAAETKLPRPFDGVSLGCPPSPLEKMPMPPLPPQEFGDNFMGIDLTAEQKKEIQQLQESDELSLLSARDSVLIARTILDSALRENPQDEIGIEAKSAEFAKNQAKLIEQQSIHESKFMKILTIEQREKLSEIQPIEPGFARLCLHRPIPQPPNHFEPESVDDVGLESDYDPTLDLDFDEDFD
jgi:Spy/CpxP family protein refolding chaperone